MSKTNISGPRTRYRFLKSGEDNQVNELSLDYFSVQLPEFKPVTGGNLLEDGEAATKLGERFRTQFANVNRIREDEVPHGLIRDIEALSADHDFNIEHLAHSYVSRNHAGEQTVVRFTAHTPLLGSALINGRMLSRVGRWLNGLPVITTAHDEIDYAPTIELVNGDHAFRITKAQQKAEGLSEYRKDEDQNFIDSLALEGIVTPPVVAIFRLTDDHGNSGYLSQTDDGWRRTTASCATLTELLGVNADLTYDHWRDADGGFTIRSHTADSVRRSLEALRFGRSDFSGTLFPNGRALKSVERWRSVADESHEIKAIQRLRTVVIELVIGMHPHVGNTNFDVFYADMAGRHVPGLNAKDWSKESVEGVVAVRALDTLTRSTADPEMNAKREAWLGMSNVPQVDSPSALPFRNRVVAGVALLAALTVDDPRREVTYPALKEHGLPRSPKSAATVAAAQALVVFHLDSTGHEGQVSSTLMSLIMHACLYRDELQGNLRWYELIDEDVNVLYSGALKEIEAPARDLDEKVGDFGPYQRALMALAGVAHVTNTELLDAKSSFTRTARGGRHGVTRADPITILQKMVKRPIGLERCIAIIEAATAEEVVIPIDPTSGDQMDEYWLRTEYADENTSANSNDDKRDDEEDPLQKWYTDLDVLLQRAQELQSFASELDERPVDLNLLGLEDGGAHPGNTMLQDYGIARGIEVVTLLSDVSRVATMGAAFFGRRKS